MKRHSSDHEDIRLAVVMNGGVSLAVWIGGVTLEINRLTNASPADDTVYGGLLELIQGKARVDVISGTSAGGINGAFLALATAYGQGLEALGELWAERGAIGELLRSPMEKAPPSLMRGDDYFLPSLAAAFGQVFPADPDTHYRSPDEVPIDLTITTSILTGEPRIFHDDFGTPIAEVDHSGTFRFRRTATTTKEQDPFRHAELTAQLALASRSTASFPFAFEASWCPVHKPGQGTYAASDIDAQHPNMAGIADFEHSRYLVDGGVLLNKPIVPALQSIRAQPASHQVRRILCYVNPDPSEEALGREADTRPASPRLARTVVDSLFTLPMAQSIDAALGELKERNERARDRRESRLAVIAGLGEHTDELAGRLYGTYRLIRRRRAAAGIAELVMEALSGDEGPQPGQNLDLPSWTRDDVIAAVDSVDEPPFVPPEELAAALDVAAGWGWGLAAVERLGYLVGDVLRRAMWLVPMGSEEEPHPSRQELLELRAQLHALLGGLRELRAADSEFWSDMGSEVPAPPEESADRPGVLKAWAGAACAAWGATDNAAVAGDHAVALADILVKTRAACDMLPAAELRDWAKEDRALLDQLLPALVPDETTDGCLRRLLNLEVTTFATGVSREDVEQVVDLIQISGNGPNSFGGPQVASKLTGVALGHFAAFYKRSWRVNDWIWGRIDGATRLVRALLAPDRLRQLGYTGEDALAAIKALATGADDPDDAAALLARFEEQRCHDELTYLDESTHPMPPSLPACAMAVARRIHLEIIREHLHSLAEAVQRDITDGAGTPSNGLYFRNAYRDALSTGNGALAAEPVFTLFREAKIGEESVEHDVGSALFASTVSTAAAVTASTLAAGEKGPKTLQGVGKALRGIAMLLYAMVRGTAMGGTSAALVTVALGVGGACLAVFLLTRATPPLVPFVGVVVLLAGLAHASLRNRLRRQGWYLVAGAVVTVVAGALLAWLVPQADQAWRPLLVNVLVVVGVIALALGMMALGGIDAVAAEKPQDEQASSASPS